MEGPDSFDWNRIYDIPDPAAGSQGQPVPEAAAPTELSPTRARRRTYNILATSLAFVWIALFISHLGLRSDLLSADVAPQLLLWISALIVALVLSLRPAERGLPRTVRVIQIIVAGIPLLFVGTAIVGTLDAPDPYSLEGIRICSAYASAIALGPLILAAFTLRRSFLSAPGWRGAAIGALCGLGGTIGIHSHCGADSTVHVLLAHGLPIVTGAIVGATLGIVWGRV